MGIVFVELEGASDDFKAPETEAGGGDEAAGTTHGENETPDIQNNENKEVEGEVIKMQGMIELAVM